MRALAKYISLFALLGAASALHADTSPTPPPATPPATGSAAGDVAAASPAAAEPAKPPPSAAEMKTRADALTAQSTDDLRTLMFVREQARKSQDVIKLNCVNDKLVQFKAVMNLQDAANHDLQAALATGSDTRVALYAQFTAQHDSAARIREDAKGCVGDNELSKQESGVEVSKPTVPDDPASQPPLTETVEPPGYASPFN